MIHSIIALGSNLGDRVDHLQRAVAELSNLMWIRRASPIYETEPMYVTEQPPFANAAILVATDLGPLALLKILKDTEKKVGRQPTERYGPREIDLDLVYYGSAMYRMDDRLQVPHPRTPERWFVLQPMLDLNASLVLPGLGDVCTLVHATTDQSLNVRKLSNGLLPVSVHGR